MLHVGRYKGDQSNKGDNKTLCPKKKKKRKVKPSTEIITLKINPLFKKFETKRLLLVQAYIK